MLFKKGQRSSYSEDENLRLDILIGCMMLGKIIYPFEPQYFHRLIRNTNKINLIKLNKMQFMKKCSTGGGKCSTVITINE